MKSRIQKTKLFLSVLSMGVLLLLILWPLIMQHQAQPVLRGSLDQKTTAAARSQSTHMLKPKLIGVDGEGNPFTINADKAIQQSESSVRLIDPEASITHPDGWYAGTSQSGSYHLENKRLDLESNVHLYNDSGYEMHTRALTLFPAKRIAQAQYPITITGPQYRLSADRLQTSLNGDVIVFTGRVEFTANE